MRTMFLAGLIACSVASTAQAQNHERTPDPQRAAALISEAQQLNIMRNGLRTARLYEKASRFYSANDPQAISPLIYAAQLYYTAGNKERASVLLERAAQLAVVRSAREAADYYIAAAIAASETGNLVAKRRLVDNALNIAANRDMSESERVGILRRIAPPLADR